MSEWESVFEMFERVCDRTVRKVSLCRIKVPGGWLYNYEAKPYIDEEIPDSWGVFVPDSDDTFRNNLAIDDLASAIIDLTEMLKRTGQ